MTGFHKGPMGFQIDFENGWTISVQFGIGNYCSNRDGAGNPFKDIPDFLDSKTAEIAAWRTDSTGRSKGMSNKEWYKFEHGEQVDGWQTPAKVLAFMNLIARKPNVKNEVGVIEGKIVMAKLCYVCNAEVLATDKECHKDIDGAYMYRHLWHGVPGITRAVGGGGGFNGYAKTLELARQRAEYYINSNPYAAPEVIQGEQMVLDEVNRLESLTIQMTTIKLPNNWDNLPGAYDPVEPQEYGGEYISECCDATPIGELDSGSPLGGTEYYRVGFCSKCKDNAVFIKEEWA